MLKAKLKVLPSGLRVVLAPVEGSPTVTVEVRVETGSKYESDREAGLSHFLEHMCFKGTVKRPTALDISREFDELGAISNAFTGTEITGYWAKAASKKLPEILDIVSDIYLNAVFKPGDVKKERGVIIEEINMYEDQPQAVAAELFERAMHGDEPAGRPIIGTKETVSSFTVEDLYAYRKKHYVASSTVLVISGTFDEKAVMKQVKRLFKDIPRGKKAGKRKTKVVRRGIRVVLKKKDIDQVSLILGVRSYPYGDKRNNAITVLRGVLASGMSSRLWHKMREQLGICYYVSAGNDASTDHGEFAVSSGVDPKRVPEAVEAILEELRRMKTELVPEAELEKVKSSLVAKTHMALETSEAVADWFGDRQVFLKDLKTPKEREREIMAVTAEDVRKAARELFTEKDLLLAVVGRDPDAAALRKALAL